MHSTAAHYRAWHVPRTHLSEAEKHASTEVRDTQLRVPWSLRTFTQLGGEGWPEASQGQEMVVCLLPMLTSLMPGLAKGCEHSDLER